MTDPTPLEARRALIQQFFTRVPHNIALGILIEDLPADGGVMRLPYAPHLVGNPHTGVIHGGVITALIDATCGAAVFMALHQPVPVATLDLRIDYLRAARAGLDVLAHAHCYKVTSNVAFVRCEAYHAEEPDAFIATGAGAFMVGTKRGTIRPAEAT
ncbi:MAG: hotdog fold thioesterase [Alphaproteobacteria bacterium]|nr:hotdog fold thioesterase [Alphaproteobacteria bacterium]